MIVFLETKVLKLWECFGRDRENTLSDFGGGSLFSLGRCVWFRIRLKLERLVEEAPCLAEVLGYVTAGLFSFYMTIATRELYFFHRSV